MPKKIDPNKQYKISLKSAVKHGRTLLRPGQNCRVSGAVLETIKEHVADYSEA